MRTSSFTDVHKHGCALLLALCGGDCGAMHLCVCVCGSGLPVVVVSVVCLCRSK